MSDLLTHEEYLALQVALITFGLYRWQYRKGAGPMMATHNPATGEEIAKISTANNVDVDVAVARRVAFDQDIGLKNIPRAKRTH